MRQGRVDEAILRYRNHIEWRKSIKDRPTWENPYFYLLLIGDLYAEQGDLEAAERSYLEAQAEGIEPSLVSDRYRFLGGKYEMRGDLEGATKVLKAHRHLDPLLFDAVLDRVVREQTRLEQLHEAQETEAPTS